jgi:hypothetical protein
MAFAMALALLLALSGAAQAQARTNGVGVYLDAGGSVCNDAVAPSDVFDAYVIASHLSASLRSIVFRVSFPSELEVVERHVNEAQFEAASPLALAGADEWSLVAHGCVSQSSLVLVHYRLRLVAAGTNLAICVEPTTQPASPPTYVTCNGMSTPMQPAYPGLGVQEGCAALNSADGDGQTGAVALCSGVLPGARWSWGTVKAQWGEAAGAQTP